MFGSLHTTNGQSDLIYRYIDTQIFNRAEQAQATTTATRSRSQWGAKVLYIYIVYVDGDDTAGISSPGYFRNIVLLHQGKIFWYSLHNFVPISRFKW